MPFASMNSLGSGVDVIVDRWVAVEVVDRETTPGLAQAAKRINKIRSTLFN